MLFVFFFNDTATTEIYTLSLHDALPILAPQPIDLEFMEWLGENGIPFSIIFTKVDKLKGGRLKMKDRKSTRLNSSHANISYAVFCLKKKKKYTPVHSHPQSDKLVVQPTI